ncbi:DUF4256 domain-containing protein [Desulfosporosinus lacus]|uniref:DUF4256 domain-containing protein n=1 Tax=Desulfosporosinus lacus TaxID=329936 RepID=UPI003D024FBB
MINVNVYHNGAESYYADRGFRGSLRGLEPAMQKSSEGQVSRSGKPYQAVVTCPYQALLH